MLLYKPLWSVERRRPTDTLLNERKSLRISGLEQFRAVRIRQKAVVRASMMHLLMSELRTVLVGVNILEVIRASQPTGRRIVVGHQSVTAKTLCHVSVAHDEPTSITMTVPHVCV